MPWLNDIDAVRPADTEFVSEGGLRFRELKRALIERLETAYVGFPGENPDRAGEALLFPIASVMVGTQAQRPTTPVREGHGWFSTDTSELWIGTSDLEWKRAAQGADDEANIAPHRAFNYDTNELAAADRLGVVQPVGEVIALNLTGLTSAIGTIGINLTDFNPAYDSTYVLAAVAISYGLNPRFITNDSLSTDPPNDNWFFRVFNAAGAGLLSTAVFLNVTLIMKEVPEV